MIQVFIWIHASMFHVKQGMKCYFMICSDIYLAPNLEVLLHRSRFLSTVGLG